MFTPIYWTTVFFFQFVNNFLALLVLCEINFLILLRWVVVQIHTLLFLVKNVM